MDRKFFSPGFVFPPILPAKQRALLPCLRLINNFLIFTNRLKRKCYLSVDCDSWTLACTIKIGSSAGSNPASKTVQNYENFLWREGGVALDVILDSPWPTGQKISQKRARQFFFVSFRTNRKNSKVEAFATYHAALILDKNCPNRTQRSQKRKFSPRYHFLRKTWLENPSGFRVSF